MSATTPFALLANATGLPWAEIPVWPVAEFVRATAKELNRGARLCAWFGVPEGSSTSLVAVLAFFILPRSGSCNVMNTRAPPLT